MYLETLHGQEKEDFIKKFTVIPSPVFETNQNQDKNSTGFSEEELTLISQKIIDAKFPEKTRELAQSYLDKAKQNITDFSGSYADILEEAITYIKERNK